MTRTRLKIIVISDAQYTRTELEHYEPRVVHVDRANRIIDVDAQVATLLTPQEA